MAPSVTFTCFTGRTSAPSNEREARPAERVVRSVSRAADTKVRAVLERIREIDAHLAERISGNCTPLSGNGPV